MIFLSDNGRGFPREKGTLYDAGIATPLILRWPGRIPAGSISGGLVSSLDIVPTILDLAGVSDDHPVRENLRGLSLLPLMTRSAPAWREAVFAERGRHDRDDPQRSVRTPRIASGPRPMMTSRTSLESKAFAMVSGFSWSISAISVTAAMTSAEPLGDISRN